jgi:hypothetical protein
MDQLISVINALGQLPEFMRLTMDFFMVLAAGGFVLFAMLGVHMGNQMINHKKIMRRLTELEAKR